MVALALIALTLTAARQPAFAAEPAGRPAAPPSDALDGQDLPPVSPQRAVRIADRTPQVRDQRRRHPKLAPRDIILYTGSDNWGIKYQDGSSGPRLADVTVDGRTGEV